MRVARYLARPERCDRSSPRPPTCRLVVIATGNTRESARRRRTTTPRRRGPIRSAAAAAASLCRARRAPTPLTAPSMTPDVHALPQHLVETIWIGCTIDGVVDLVDVVLVQQQPVQRPRTCGRARPPRGCSARSTRAMPMPATATPTRRAISIEFGRLARRSPRGRAASPAAGAVSPAGAADSDRRPRLACA